LRLLIVISQYVEDMPEGIEVEGKKWFNSYINDLFSYSNERVANEYEVRLLHCCASVREENEYTKHVRLLIIDHVDEHLLHLFSAQGSK
jgi:hypothetical protein